MGTNNTPTIIIDETPAPAVKLPCPDKIESDKAIDEMCTMLDWFADSDDGFPFLADGEIEECIPAFKE